MEKIVEKVIDYLNENFSESFYVDYEEDEKKQVVFIQFLMDKVIKIDSAIDFFNRVNESKNLCKKQELELWKTKEEEPIIQISYFI